jgi:ferredoxin-fold anticodon binding domain-containing protein
LSNKDLRYEHLEHKLNQLAILFKRNSDDQYFGDFSYKDLRYEHLEHKLNQLAILFKRNGDEESEFNRVLIRARGATLK